MRNLNCLRCYVEMRYISTEKIQLGQTGWILGDLPNLVAGAMEADIYCCPRCGKIELFQATHPTGETALPQKVCPNCGKAHDFDYPKCPFSKFDYQNSKP